MNAGGTIRSGELPIEYSSFVGHREQLAAARAALGTTRLLTLVGPGGVGKTRFAIRLAQSVRRLYPDGTWFIDLSGITKGGSVTDEVDRVLELKSDFADEYQAVTQFLAPKRALLILDTCEQVVDDCAQLVRRVLRASPAVTVLTTSREALRITPERVFVIEPLETESREGSPSPAVTLFLDRCATVLTDPTSSDLETIAEICRRLDGLPLAIELAATRVKTLTPVQILDRLAEPLGFLTGGHRDVPHRQQTVRATIDWSYRLCSEAERALWRSMAVFVGGWDLEAAEWMSVGSTGEDTVLDTVQSLLEKSIVTRRRAGRHVSFSMLDTVRVFGLEVVSSEEREAAQARHRDWYLGQLARLEADWYGPHQAQWLSYSLREMPNIRVALQFCLEHGDAGRAATLLASAWRVVWQAHGRIDEWRRWSIRVLELESTRTPEICQVMTRLGGVEILLGDTGAGWRRLDHAAVLADELDDDFSRAFVVAMRTAIEGDAEAAVTGLTESLAIQGGVDLFIARENVEVQLALVHDRLGHTTIADRMRETLVARAIRVGDSFETARFLLNAGVIAESRNEFENADARLRQCLTLASNLEDPRNLAVVQETLASVAAGRQDYKRAATLLGLTHTVAGARGAMASVFPSLPSIRSDTEALARRMLGKAADDTAFARGKALTIAEGVAYALGAELPPERERRPRPSGSQVLTERESQVAALVGQGLSDKDIAERLVISRRTAEGHVAKCLMKLGFTSRTQLAAWSALASSPDAS